MQGYMKTLEEMCERKHGVKDKARELQAIGHFTGKLQGNNKGKCTKERSSNSVEDTRNPYRLARGV